MHIVHAISTFFPDYRAGTEIYVLNLCKELQKKGVQASVVTANFNHPTNYVYEGVEVYSFQVRKQPDAHEMNGLKKPLGLEAFLGILKELNPDIVHFHTFNRAINSVHLSEAKVMGFKVVFTSHLAGLFCVKNDFLYKNKIECKGQISELRCTSCILQAKGIETPWNDVFSALTFCATHIPILKNIYPALSLIKNKKQEFNTLMQKADSVVVLSDWISDIYRNNGLFKSHLIRQGVAGSDSLSIQSRKSDVVRFGFVGRLSPIKGVDLLLEAFQMLAASDCLLHLVVITEHDDYYEKIKGKTQNDSRIVWSENKSSEEVSSILDGIDVLCLPSLIREMAPLSILEAFSKRIPVVGADHGGIADMVKHEYSGLLFKSGSAQSLAEQLNRMIQDQELIERLKENIPPPRFFSAVANDHIRLYQTLIQT